MDITTLHPEQLQSIRKGLLEEIQFISNSYATLKIAVNRFNVSLEGISEMNSKNQDQEVLVPLTSSMYIPGQLSDIKTLLVDIGTGYFVEKPAPAAEKYIRKRIQMLAQNMENVQNSLMAKRKDLDAVSMVINQKVKQMREAASQQQQKSKSIL